MDLRERTIYLRLSTYHDLLNDATHIELIHRLDDLNRRPFENFQNLLHRGRPKKFTAQVMLDHLHTMVGAGVNQGARFRMWNEKGSPVRSLEVFAGAHPYSGVFHTTLDIRFERSWFEENPQATPRVFRHWFERLVRLTQPFQAHAHDTDDNSIQNIDKPNLLRRAYGVEVDGEIDLESNPGREIARAEYRYAVNWLTVFGPEMQARFEGDVVRSVPDATVHAWELAKEKRRVLPGFEIARKMHDEDEAQNREVERDDGSMLPVDELPWLVVELYPNPLNPEQPEKRAAQRAVREHLQMVERARQERWMLGYWQKK